MDRTSGGPPACPPRAGSLTVRPRRVTVDGERKVWGCRAVCYGFSQKSRTAHPKSSSHSLYLGLEGKYALEPPGMRLRLLPPWGMEQAPAPPPQLPTPMQHSAWGVPSGPSSWFFSSLLFNSVLLDPSTAHRFGGGMNVKNIQNIVPFRRICDHQLE